MTDNTDDETDEEPALKAEDYNRSPDELLELADTEKYTNGFRPRYKPDWGEEGRIHLDGEKDFSPVTPGGEVADALRDICEEVGGLVTTGTVEEADEDIRWFKVGSQFGALTYWCFYRPGEPVHKIAFVERDTVPEPASSPMTAPHDSGEPGAHDSVEATYVYTLEELKDVDSFMWTFLTECVEWEVSIEQDQEPTNIHDL